MARCADTRANRTRRRRTSRADGALWLSSAGLNCAPSRWNFWRTGSALNRSHILLWIFFGDDMSKLRIVHTPHRLGKEEAVRRLRSGLSKAQASYSHLFAVHEETWTGDHLQFRISALGQT